MGRLPRWISVRTLSLAAIGVSLAVPEQSLGSLLERDARLAADVADAERRAMVRALHAARRRCRAYRNGIAHDRRLETIRSGGDRDHSGRGERSLSRRPSRANGRRTVCLLTRS